MKQIFLFSLLLLSALTCKADQKQTVVVNGSQVEKSVKSISFQGSKVLLTYTDGTTQTADRSAFLIRMRGLSTTKISNLKTSKDNGNKYYTIDGKRMDKPSKSGVYIKGNKKITKK